MINDYIIESLKNIIRNKKNILLISISSLLLILLFLDIIFIKNFYSYINYTTNTNIAFRTFTADKVGTNITDSSNELKKLDNVAEVYKAAYGFTYVRTNLKFNGLDGRLELDYGTENITPPSIMGKSIKDLKSGEMICPIAFYPDSHSSGVKIDGNKIVPPEKTLNYEFNVYYQIYKYENDELIVAEDNATKKFKIVGLYDNKLVMNNNNQCYITPKDMIEFSNSLNPQINDDETDGVILNIVVDKAKNLNKVKNEVKSLGYYVSDDTNMAFDEKQINTLALLAFSFFIIIIGTILFMYVSYLHKKAKSESKLLGILRSCGYTIDDILKKEVVEIVIILFFSFLISSTIFSVIFSLLIKDNFDYTIYSGFYVKNSILLLFTSFVILLFTLALIELRIVRKNIDKSISNLLMED